MSSYSDRETSGRLMTTICCGIAFVTREDIDSPREWKRLQFALDVQWSGMPLLPRSMVRVVPTGDSTGLVCTSGLWPVGRIAMPFDCTAWHTEALIGDDGKLLLSLYGPEHRAVN